MPAQHIGPAELVELANRGESRSLSIDAAALPRLAAVLSADNERPEPLRASVDFRRGANGQPELHITVRGALGVTCQRCLQLMRRDVDIDVNLQVFASEAEALGALDPFDSVTFDADGLDLLAIIEDEVLADLPLAPVHEVRGECGTIATGDRPDDNKAPSEKMHRPFAALDGMLGGKDNTQPD